MISLNLRMRSVLPTTVSRLILARICNDPTRTTPTFVRARITTRYPRHHRLFLCRRSLGARRHRQTVLHRQHPATRARTLRMRNLLRIKRRASARLRNTSLPRSSSLLPWRMLSLISRRPAKRPKTRSASGRRSVPASSKSSTPSKRSAAWPVTPSRPSKKSATHVSAWKPSARTSKPAWQPSTTARRRRKRAASIASKHFQRYPGFPSHIYDVSALPAPWG